MAVNSATLQNPLQHDAPAHDTVQQSVAAAQNNNAIAAHTPQSNDPIAGAGAVMQPNGIPTLDIQTIVGIFDSEEQAQQAVDALRQAGYDERQANTLGADPQTPVNVHADDAPVSQGMVLGGTAGAVAGAAVVGLATFALPAAGAALALGALSGHITGVAGGALVGSVAGGTAGSYKGMQPPADAAQDGAGGAQADEMRDEGFVVALKIPKDAAPDPAIEVLRQQGARDTQVFGPAL